MNEGVQQQNPDGSWSTAVPLGWQGPEDQVDVEVYSEGADGWRAEAYNRADPVGAFRARTRMGIVLRAAWRFRGRPRTYLWDAA